MKNIVVIYGGGSCEKDISVITALQAMESIDKTKYNVVPLFGKKVFIFSIITEIWESMLIKTISTERGR